MPHADLVAFGTYGPGSATWSFALVYGGRVLAEQRFAVVLAAEAGASAKACLPAVS